MNFYPVTPLLIRTYAQQVFHKVTNLTFLHLRRFSVANSMLLRKIGYWSFSTKKYSQINAYYRCTVEMYFGQLLKPGLNSHYLQ